MMLVDTEDDPKIADATAPLPRAALERADITAVRVHAHVVKNDREPTPLTCVGSLQVPLCLTR
jgi:glutaredoxin 2